MSLSIFLFIVPLLSIFSALILYRFTGRKELFKLDSIQFFYAFILYPLFFVWAKTLFFTLIRNELIIPLSENEIFILDTVFTVFLLYIFAFVVIHSLTKTFNLQTYRDPLYDIFHHSEYFHLWVTHLAMYGGVMAVLTIFSLANMYFPVPLDIHKSIFYLICFLGVVCGVGGFVGVWLSDPKQAKSFMRVMKLIMSGFFIVHVISYFIFNVSFSAAQSMYWFSTFVFATMVLLSLFTYRSTKANTFIEKISNGFKHKEWDFRLDLFGEKK